MSIRGGLVSILTGENSISTLVSTRVYVGNAPQTATFPHIVITQMSSDEMPALDGTPGLRNVRFDIDCKDTRGVDCETLGNAVRVFIDDYSGTAGSETIDAVFLHDESTDIEEPRSGEGNPIYVTTLDISVQYTPA